MYAESVHQQKKICSNKQNQKKEKREFKHCLMMWAHRGNKMEIDSKKGGAKGEGDDNHLTYIPTGSRLAER